MLIPRTFHIPTKTLVDLEIVESTEPNEVHIRIGPAFVTLSPEQTEALRNILDPYRGYALDHIRFAPTPESLPETLREVPNAEKQSGKLDKNS